MADYFEKYSASLGSTPINMCIEAELLKDQVKSLKNELENERRHFRHSQKEKTLEIHNQIESEKIKTKTCLSEQAEKLCIQKNKEIESLKDSLSNAHRQEVENITSKKDAQIENLKIDLDKKDMLLLQQLVGHDNYDTTNEQPTMMLTNKLLNDVQKLRDTKRHLEETVSAMSISDCYKVDVLRHRSETPECDVEKTRKVLVEMERMIEELKSKDNIISKLERQLGHHETASRESDSKMQKGETTTCISMESEPPLQRSNGAKGTSRKEGLVSSLPFLPPIKEEPCDRRHPTRVIPPLSKLEEEERKTTALTEEKANLLKRLSEMDRRTKQVQDRSRKYVEKNMDLTAVKRCLEDKMKALKEENKQLKEQSVEGRRKLDHVTRQLTTERSVKEGLESQTGEIETLQQQLSEHIKTITALKQTCSEKDRRIELIQHRKKRRRLERSQEMLSGMKETFFGYDEDNQSVDSELSSISFDNSLEDDTWDEFARDQFEQKYQRLSREHLQLEKSYALLQSHNEMIQDPQRENKSRSDLESDLFKAQCKIEELEKLFKLSGKDSKILDEAKRLKVENEKFLQMISELKTIKQKLKEELNESREREEELEFKFLEIEESDDEFKKPFQTSSPQKSFEDEREVILEQVIGEAKLQGINFQDLLNELEDAKNHMDVAGSDQSKIALLKAHAFLEILDKTLKNSRAFQNDPVESEHCHGNLQFATTTTIKPVSADWLNQRGGLQQQRLQSDQEDVEEENSPDSSFSTDKLTRQLTTAQKRIVKLENVFHEVNKAVEVYKEKLSMAEERSIRERADLELLRSQLKRLLDDPSSGSIVLTERLDQLEQAEKRADELQKTAWELQSKVISLQRDKHMLEERLESSDNGRIIILAEDTEVQAEMEQLRERASLCEKAETELSEKNLSLEKDLYEYRGEITKLKSQLPSVGNVNNSESKPENVANLQAKLAALQFELDEKSAELNHMKTVLIDGEILQQLGDEMGHVKEQNLILRSQLQEKTSPSGKWLSIDMFESKLIDCDNKNCIAVAQDLDNAHEILERLQKRLRLAEDTINDLESSEGELRDNLELTEKKEMDYRKRISNLQKTVRELRDQLADRDIIEESLQQKVDSLVGLESSRSERIKELESIESSLRHHLEVKDELEDNIDLVASLEATVEELKATNCELYDKIEEYEESETILKNNWKAVAEEDNSRIMQQEEKIRTLSLTNNQLKSKLQQDEADASLIEEIQLSPSFSPRLSSRSESNLDDVGRMSLPGDMSSKIDELENRLQLVIEEKNSKIETLQEKLDDVRETEIKLSETVFEMEQEEKHLRAKLALYENSVVTVENMARYEAKFEEMRSSEHDLLTRMNSLENREDDLKDCLQQTEVRHRSEVDRLEKQMSNYQKLEERLLDKIKELEDHNKNLEKKAQGSKSTVIQTSSKPSESREKEIDGLKTRVRDLRVKVSSLEKENSELKKKLEEVLKEKEDLLSSSKELTNRLKHLDYLENKVQLLQDAELKFSERISDLEQENTQLEEKLCEEEQILERNKKLEARIAQLEYLEQKVEVLQDAEFKFSERISELEEVNLKLEQKLVNEKLQDNETQGAKSDLIQKNQQLEEEIQDLSLLVQKQSVMQVDGEGLREKVSLLERAEDKLMERVDELELIEIKLQEKLAEAEKQVNALPDVKEKLDVSQNELAHLKVAIEEWKTKCTSLTEEVGKKQAARSKHEEKIKILLLTEENLTQTLSEQQIREKELESELESSEDKVENLENKTKELQSKITKLQTELNTFISQQNNNNSDELQAELETTQDKLEEVQTEYEQKIEELLLQRQQLIDSYEDKIKELILNGNITKQTLQQETAVKVSALHEKINDVSSQLDKQLHINKTREENLNELNKENAQQKDQIGQLEMLVDAIKSVQSESNSSTQLPQEDSTPKKFQSTCSLLFNSANDVSSNAHDTSIEDRTAEGSETESQSPGIKIGNISQDSSLEELLMERERLLLEIEELKHSLDQQQYQSDRLQKLTIEETRSEFVTKEIVYKAKIDQMSDKRLPQQLSVIGQNKSDLQDQVEELLKRETLYCKEIEEMHKNFSRLRQNSQFSQGSFKNLPHKNYTQMSQKELVSTVHELEGEQTQLRQNLEDLNEQFNLFREAVDEITASLKEEVLDGSPARRENKKHYSSDLMTKFSHLAESEVELRDKINFLRVSGLSPEQSEEGDHHSLTEYKSLVMELREKVDSLQEKESRLKRRLYDKAGIGPNTQVRKLYDRIIDLEASESRLQRKVEYLRLSEEDLHRRLATTQKQEHSQSPKSVLRTSVLPKHDLKREELQITVEQLKKNESSLTKQVSELQRKDEDLTNRIGALTASEKALKRRLEFTEIEEKGDNTMLDKTEEALGHRVRELEKVEKQMKKQISELEQNREELHQITSKDKSLIHEKNMKIQDLQLSEKALKEQLNKLELSERLLHVKVETLEDQVESLEDEIHELKGKQKKYQEILKKYKLEGELISAKSENMVSTVEELSVSETALKKRVQELELRNSEVEYKSENLDLQLKSVEDAKSQLNRHLHEAEQEKKALNDQINAVQHLEGTSQQRNVELAKLNINFSDKIIKLQEEKASLVYRLSQFKLQLEEAERKLGTVKGSELQLKHEVSNLEKCEQGLHKEVKEFRLRDIDSQGKIREMEQEVMLLKDQVTKLRHRENTLRFRVQELENANPGAQLSPSQDLEMSLKFNNYQEKILNLTQENEKLKSHMDKQNILAQSPSEVSLSTNEINELRNKAIRLEELEFQKNQLEELNSQLKLTIEELHVRSKDDFSPRSVFEEKIRPAIDMRRETVSMTMCSPAHSREDAIAGIVESLPKDNSNSGEKDLRKLSSSSEVEDVMHKVSKEKIQSTKTIQLKAFPTKSETVVEEEQWQKIEDLNFDQLDDSVSDDSHWGKVELTNQSEMKSKVKHTDEIGMDICLQSEQSSNESDSPGQEEPIRNIKGGKTLTIFKTETRLNMMNNAPPPLPSSLPPSLPTGLPQDLSKGSITKDICLSADEMPDFETYDEENNISPMSAKPAHGLSGDHGNSNTNITNIGNNLVERLEHVEKQLSETLSTNPAQLDDFKWKKEAEENARKFSLSEKENKALKDEINTLDKKVEEQTRYIGILEKLLKSLEHIMSEKGDKSDEEMTRSIEQALKKSTSEVKVNQMTSHSGVKDTAALVTDLHRKERDLVAKYNEVSHLKRELQVWQDDFHSVEQMRVNALDSLRSLEVEVLNLQGSEEELIDLKEKFNKSQQKASTLEEKCESLETAMQQKEISDQENKLFKQRLEDHGKMEAEFALLKGQSEVNQKALQDLMESEKAQLEENQNLKKKIIELEKTLKEKSKIESEIEELQSKYDKLEEDNVNHMTEISQLQQQLTDLTKQCQDKDADIQRLSAELEKMKVKEDKLVLETPATNGLNGSVSSPDISFQEDEIVSSTQRQVETRPLSPASSVSFDGLPARSASVEPTQTRRRFLPKARSVTPSPISNGYSRTNQARYQSKVTLNLQNKEDSSRDPKRKTFVAVANYNPQLFSRSNRPGQELKLQEGDTVIVQGEKDDQGYYKAEVNGQSGIVPASYLLPLPLDMEVVRSMAERRQKQLQRVPSYLDQSPEHILQLHSDLQKSAHDIRAAPKDRTHSPITLTRPRTAPASTEGRRHLPRVNGNGVPQAREMFTSQTLPRLHKPIPIHSKSLSLQRPRSNVFEGPPSPPRSFTVERIVGDRGVMLSWHSPDLDEFARSNGSELAGYTIYLNGKLCKKINSPHMGKTVVENLDVQDSLKFLIQSVAVNGQASSLVEAVCDGDLSRSFESSFEGDSETDLTGVLSGAHYDKGYKRDFLAVYDYSPLEHSPHDYTGYELGFHAGEAITIYGRLRPDGFYHGEINGQRGLVPASFIEEVPYSAHSKRGVSHASLKLTSQRTQ